MLVTGLSETALRSLLNTITVEGFALNNTVYLFSGTPPDSLEDIGITFTRSPEGDAIALAVAADAILNLSVSLENSAGQIKFNIANGVFSSYNEKHIAYKPNASVAAYNIGQSAWSTLGDCLIYYANNATSRTIASSSFPTVIIPTRASPEYRLEKLAANAGLSGKNIRSISSVGNWYAYFGRSGRNKNASGQDIPYNSERGTFITIFDAPVEADFMLINLGRLGNVYRNTTLTHVSLLLENDTFVELPTFAVAPDNLYKLPFTKRVIKGIRIANAYEAIGTSSDIWVNFYVTVFTAGLQDYATSDLAEVTRDPLTWGLMVPTLDTKTRGLATHAKPLLMLSVGGEGSGSDLEISGHDQMYLRHDSVVSRSLLDLTK